MLSDLKSLPNSFVSPGRITEIFGQEICELQQEYEKKVPFLNRGFIVPSDIPDDSLLFLGINPSFSNESEPEHPLSCFYQHSQKHGHKYFKKFDKMSEELEYKWSHWDLLLVRETKQTLVGGLLNKKEGIHFIRKNLALSKRVLESTKPLAIIVNNTLARRFLGKDQNNGQEVWMDYHFEWDDKIGTYRITNSGSALEVL